MDGQGWAGVIVMGMMNFAQWFLSRDKQKVDGPKTRSETLLIDEERSRKSSEASSKELDTAWQRIAEQRVKIDHLMQQLDACQIVLNNMKEQNVLLTRTNDMQATEISMLKAESQLRNKY